MNNKYRTPIIVLLSELMMIWAHSQGSSVWWLAIVTVLNAISLAVWAADNMKE